MSYVYLWTFSLLITVSFYLIIPWELHLTVCCLKGMYKLLFTIWLSHFIYLCLYVYLCLHLVEHVCLLVPWNCRWWLTWLNNRVLGLCLRKPKCFFCDFFYYSQTSLYDVKLTGFHSYWNISYKESSQPMLIYDTKTFGLDTRNLIRAAGALTHLSLETKCGVMCLMLKWKYMPTFLGNEEIFTETIIFCFGKKS